MIRSYIRQVGRIEEDRVEIELDSETLEEVSVEEVSSYEGSLSKLWERARILRAERGTLKQYALIEFDMLNDIRVNASALSITVSRAVAVL
jgi:hypothetical protein